MHLLIAGAVTAIALAGSIIGTGLSHVKQDIAAQNLKYRTLTQSTLPDAFEELHDADADIIARIRSLPQSNPVQLGATNQIPTAIAFYEDTLAAAISTSATSFTLVRGTDKTGAQLASSTYAFVISEGTPNEEIVLADCTYRTCTNAARGISPLTGTSSVSALQKTHRRGDSVKITDAPFIPQFQRLLAGVGGFQNPIKYDGVSTSTLGEDADNIASIQYVNDAAFTGGGAVAASASASGYVELASYNELLDATTVGGTGARLVLTPEFNTMTCPIAFGRILVASSTTGKLDGNCAPATFYNATTFKAATTIATTTVSTGTTNIASTSLTSFTSSTTPTTTWTKKVNLRYVIVEVVGGGGGGGIANTNNVGSTGGGGGGYCKKLILASSLGATETVTVGGAGGNNPVTYGGPSSFGSHCVTGGGAGGAQETSATPEGGAASSGDINIGGQDGFNRTYDGTNPIFAGAGGGSVLGTGGAGGIGGVSSSGEAGSGYGAGGGGGVGTGSNVTGGAGTAGAVFVWEVYY
jgi:hypothetical protein